MLQAISSQHDAHHERRRKNSLASLTGSLRDKKVHLLLAASGSVATIKLPLIIEALGKKHSERNSGKELSIRVLLTPAASRFLGGQSHEQPPLSSLLSTPCVDGVYVDADEWREPWKRGDAILHIELRRDVSILFLPLNSVSRGFADGILTSVVRAWDAWGELDSDLVLANGEQPLLDGNRRRRQKKHIIVAPAMNTAMWRHPVTAKSLRVLEEEWGVYRNSNKAAQAPTADESHTVEEQVENADTDDDGGWFEVLRPQQKTLACGDVGDGAMMEWKDIVTVIEDRLGLNE
ncbi:putative thymidylate synthase [Daldinia childiae]|uniref:putative thymidylate synthase n=1 Tax=Daldinia childiae TaxID=326645 RepID=UPI0014470DDB|nr:putative thymidylate synthase [Daldinia childiae]KAF3058140.1 putative thymidylate synthase [Daldinia childiae]